MLTAPPAAESVVEPDATVTSPPRPALDEPTLTLTWPALAEELPVSIAMTPEAREGADADPVVSDSGPEDPSSASDVERRSAPVAPDALPPVETETSPPAPPAAAVNPAARRTLPPFPALPGPTEKLRSPPAPPAALPDENARLPLPSILLVPLTIVTCPLAPAAAASDDPIAILPDDAALPTPLARRTSPPTPSCDAPP